MTRVVRVEPPHERCSPSEVRTVEALLHATLHGWTSSATRIAAVLRAWPRKR